MDSSEFEANILGQNGVDLRYLAFYGYKWGAVQHDQNRYENIFYAESVTDLGQGEIFLYLEFCILFLC